MELVGGRGSDRKWVVQRRFIRMTPHITPPYERAGSRSSKKKSPLVGPIGKLLQYKIIIPMRKSWKVLGQTHLLRAARPRNSKALQTASRKLDLCDSDDSVISDRDDVWKVVL